MKVNPHLQISLVGVSPGDPGAVPPKCDANQSLLLTFDLGIYTVPQLTDLLDALEKRVKKWVEDNPPES